MESDGKRAPTSAHESLHSNCLVARLQHQIDHVLQRLLLEYLLPIWLDNVVHSPPNGDLGRIGKWGFLRAEYNGHCYACVTSHEGVRCRGWNAFCDGHIQRRPH